MNTSTIYLNNETIKNWLIQWKTNVNPDAIKQAQEVIFLKKLQKTNQNPVFSITTPFNYVGMNLDTNLNFQERLNTNALNGVNKAIGLLRKLQALSPCQSLFTVYKIYRTLSQLRDIIFEIKVIINASIKKWSQYNLTLR